MLDMLSGFSAAVSVEQFPDDDRVGPKHFATECDFNVILNKREIVNSFRLHAAVARPVYFACGLKPRSLVLVFVNSFRDGNE
jgi:hypothetical protein